MIILAVDTALRTTGYGILQVENKQMKPLDCGVISNKRSLSHSACLARLASGVEQLLGTFNPGIGVIEGGFYGRNPKTAMVLGMARGVVVGLMGKADIPIYEYAPRRAKQAVVGYGNASKEQVAAMVAQMLNLNISDISDDATDAMALAVCHALNMQSHQGVYLPDPI